MRNTLLIALGMAGALGLAVPARAQDIPGDFTPTVFGQIQEDVSPFRFYSPQGVPLFAGKSEVLKKEIDLLRRPYIRQISTYVNQSLIPQAGQLDAFTNGVQVGYAPTLQLRTRFSYLPTIFGRAGLKGPNFFGEEFRIGIDHQPTDKFAYRTNIGLFQFVGNRLTDPGVSLIGNQLFTYRLNDRVRFAAGYRRDIVANTQLSAIGLDLPINRALVGRAKQNTFFVSTTVRPTLKTSIAMLYAGGFIDGHKIQDNPFQQGTLYMSHVAYARDADRPIALVLPSYSFNVLSFANNNISQGNLVLVTDPPRNPREYVARLTSSARGQTNLPRTANTPRNTGVGGYFSPQFNYFHTARLDVSGSVVGKLRYRAGGGVGITDTDTTSSNLGKPDFFGTASATVYVPVRDRVRIEAGWRFLQVATGYRRNLLYAQNTYYF